jgi:RNA polymerase sigma-70 factor (ECF subfamily)
MQLRIEDDLFESLFAREYRGVVAAASRVVGLSAAEDIAQEAFAALYRLGPIEPQHARNWLYRTTLHRALSDLRGVQRRQIREKNATTHLDAPPGEPHTAVEVHETRENVRAVLRRISERYAMLLALRHSGLSHKEISELMLIKINQVGTLLVRAEAAFKREYDRVTPR